jgi:hypothetical protein
MEVLKNLEIVMITYNLMATFEKTTGLERLAIPFARNGIKLLMEGEIEEGFESLADATNMLHMVKEEPEYVRDYYDYLVEEGRLDRRDKKDLTGEDNEQQLNVEKVSYLVEEKKINQVDIKVQNSNTIQIITENKFQYHNRINQLNIKEENDLDMIIKEQNDLDMIIKKQNDPDRIINNKVSSNRVTKEKNDLDMIIKEQYDFDTSVKGNCKDLYKINKEENNQNSLDKIIKEDINIDSANNKDKENKMNMIECDLVGSIKLGIIEGCIEVIMEDDNCKCEHRQGSNLDIIKSFIEQKDITKFEHGEDPSIDIIEGFSEQEDNIYCEHENDPNIGVFIKVNQEEKNECELRNHRNIDVIKDFIKDFIKVMQEDKGKRNSTCKRLVKWENHQRFQHHTMTTRMSIFKMPRQTWWIGWYEWLWWTEWSWWKHFILNHNEDKH